MKILFNRQKTYSEKNEMFFHDTKCPFQNQVLISNIHIKSTNNDTV